MFLERYLCRQLREVIFTSKIGNMTQNLGKNNNKVYKLVLTGGPCGGKTTGQARLSNFFENLGWKVYRVPETSTVLQGAGIKFTDLTAEEVHRFQENLMRTMLQIESTYIDLASSSKQNTLIICDRGIMDATAYMPADNWERIKLDNNWNEVELRDSRYNQVIHMVSAAEGAEQFYTTEDHVIRHETADQARELDARIKQAWVGHPYFDVIDNSTDFENKVRRMTASVCSRLGIDTGDRLHQGSRKRKYLISSIPKGMALFLTGDATESGPELTSADHDFPQFQDFVVVHEYLSTPNQDYQARIRKRGQNVKWDAKTQSLDLSTGDWSYVHTIRKPTANKEKIELKMSIAKREYVLLHAQKDRDHFTIFKRRRCFLWNNQYFHLDLYQEPCHPRCKNLMILETYTTSNEERLQLPTFLKIQEEVTDNPGYSMYNLSLRSEWSDDLKKLCKAYNNNHTVSDKTKANMATNKPVESGEAKS